MATSDDAKKRANRRKLNGSRQPWFEANEQEAPRLVFQRVNGLRSSDLATYRERVLQNMRLYAGTRAVNGTDSTLPGQRSRYNLVRSVVDTGVSVLVSARTLPYGQTRGADWSLRRQVAKFNRAIQQQFGSCVFGQTPQVVLDALVTGLGALKFFADPTQAGATAGCERSLPLSTVWDPAEASAGNLTQLWEVRLVNRDQLAELYPNHAEAISRAAGPSEYDLTDFQLTRGGAKANQCVVIEAWRLPSSAEAGDGKHGVYVSTATLHTEEWTRPRFPFAFLKGWQPGMLGFTGTSLAELVEPAQTRIEELHDFTDACQNLGSVPRLLVDSNSEVEPGQVNNLPLQLIRYKGGTNAPVFHTFDATPHDLEGSIAQIREQTLSMVGLSSQQTQGEKPAGVNSAVGLRAAEDISSKRHIANIRYVEQFYLDCSWCLIDTNNQIAEIDPGFAIDSAARGAWLESSDWKKIAPSETQAKLAVLPMAALMGSPSAFFQTTSEWIQLGYVSPETSKILQGLPDVEGQTERDTADQTYAGWLCDRIADSEVVSVDPYADVQQILPFVRTQYVQALTQAADAPILAEYRRVLDLLKGRVDAVVAAQQAAQAPAPAGQPVAA